MNAKAFTLAEVLITLGIIGVVAAMTLPTLVQRYKEQETVTRVKKFYSGFSQAYMQAVMDNGTIDNWGLTDSVIETDDGGNNIHSEESLENYDKFLEKMKPYLKNIRYEKFSTNKLKSSSGIVLPDGTAVISMWLQPSSCTDDKKYCGDLYISTDGGAMYEDTRGIVRKTVFAFIINRNRIMPVGLENSDFKSNCLTGKKYSHCTGWVITHGNMDYLHCNDLDFNTKTKCKD